MPSETSLSESHTLHNMPESEKQQESPSQTTDKAPDWTVSWDGDDDSGDPLNTPSWRKWMMVAVLGVACACVTCCSSMAADTYPGMEEEFNVSQEVCILSVSLFVTGLGLGPMILGPISEFLGRKPVLWYGFGAFFLLNFPVAFGNHIAIHLVFRFLTGFAGSAFLSVSGGAISDVFPNHQVGTPMMIFSAAPFVGPVLGPLFSGFINQNTYWRWTFYVVIIWAFVMMISIILFVPETYNAELLRRRAAHIRKNTGEEKWQAPIEKLNRSFSQALKKSIKTPFILMSTQMMVLLLNLWSAIILGVLYLSFGGIPYVFKNQYGFDVQQTGLAFLGIGLGQIMAVACQPFFNSHYRKVSERHNGAAPPETRLIMGMFGAVCCPIGLLLFGLTSFTNVPWIIPILCSLFFGLGMVWSFTSTFTYLVDAYRPVAASALASNSFCRSAFAAGFPLFGQQMYGRLGAVGGSCVLGGILVLTIPLPFIFYRIGARIRQRSTFSAS